MYLLKHIFYSLLFLFSLSKTSFSQIDTLSLSTAIERAQKNNATKTIAEIGIKQSESQLHESMNARYPVIFFHSHLMETPFYGYDAAVTNGGEYGIQFSSSYPLYDGGMKNLIINQSATAVEKSRLNLKKNTQELAFAVRMQYYEIARAEEELSIRTETVHRLQDYITFLEQLKNGGTATESDVIKTQIDLNNARIEVERTKQSVTKAKLFLVNLLGDSLNKEIEITSFTSQDSLKIPSFSFDETPDYKILESDRTSAANDITIAQMERLPTLSISGDFGVLGIYPKEIGHNLGYSLLLSLDIPIFSWGTIDSRIEQKQFAKEQMDVEITFQRRERETAWRNAVSELELAQKNMGSYQNNREEAEKNYHSAKLRFAGGSGSTLDVLDAQRLMVETKLNYNTTLFEYRSSLAQLLKLSGK